MVRVFGFEVSDSLVAVLAILCFLWIAVHIYRSFNESRFANHPRLDRTFRGGRW